MPIIKSAKKAVRQTKRRTGQNKKKKLFLKSKITNFKKSKSQKDLTLIYSLTDKLVKAGVIHKNKAKRIKRQAARLITKASLKKIPKKEKN